MRLVAAFTRTATLLPPPDVQSQETPSASRQLALRDVGCLADPSPLGRLGQYAAGADLLEQLFLAPVMDLPSAQIGLAVSLTKTTDSDDVGAGV